MSRLFDVLSERLEEPIETIWQIAIHGKQVEGALGICMIIAFCVMEYIIYRILTHIAKGGGMEEDDVLFATLISILLVTVLLIILFHALIPLLAPEWCVIKDLL